MEGTLSGGKKWASGTGTISSSTTKFTFSGTTSILAKAYIDIQLTFTPSVIMVNSRDSDDREHLSLLNNGGLLYSKSNVKVSGYDIDAYSNLSTYNFKNDSCVSLGNNIYRIPMHSSSVSNINWVAYE